MEEEVHILTNEEIEELGSYFLDDDLTLYLTEIKRYPLLSREQQKDLAINGDKKKLILHNLRLVVSIASSYKNKVKHLKFLDLIQEGNLGLIRAVDSYDPSKGSLSTYASPWIKQKIRRAIYNKEQEIRKPCLLNEQYRKYLRLITDCLNNGLPIPSKEEICQRLKILPETYDILLSIPLLEPKSLSEPINYESNVEISDLIPDEQAFFEDDLFDNIAYEDSLKTLKMVLNPIQYFVFYNRYCINNPLSLEKVGDYLGITRERIRQIEDKTLEIVKSYMDVSNNSLKERLSELKIDINKIKQQPINPLDIVKFLYLKNSLTPEESQLYELLFLSNYIYTTKELCENLALSKKELEKVIFSLTTKINDKFQNKEGFSNFKKIIIYIYSSYIFNYKKIMAYEIDYLTLFNTYFNLTSKEIIACFENVGILISDEDKKMINMCFGDTSFNLRNYNLQNRLKLLLTLQNLHNQRLIKIDEENTRMRKKD